MTFDDTVQGKLEEAWRQVNEYFDAAVKAVEAVMRKPEWVTNELRRRAAEMVTVADQVHAWATGRPERDAYLAWHFEEGVRTTASGLKMTASGLEQRDTLLIEGAAKLRTDGMAQAFAAKEAAGR